MRTNKSIKLTIFASGSEVNLAIDTSHKLAKYKIYSKVISVPSQELFELKKNSYKNKILYETKYKFSIEAGSTNCWRQFVTEKGFCFGIDNYGKSAPYKDVFKYFGLTSNDIAKKIKKMINN